MVIPPEAGGILLRMEQDMDLMGGGGGGGGGGGER